MKLSKYITKSEDILLASQAEQVRAVQVLMEAVRLRRDELRVLNEEHPKRSPEDLTEDIVGISGEIRGLNWVLMLPQRSKDFIDKL